jgi:hypothetical protein
VGGELRESGPAGRAAGGVGRERDRRRRVGERRVRDIDWYLEPEAGGAIAKLALVMMRLEQGTAGFPLRREGGGEVVSEGEAKSKALVGSYNNKISPNRT